MSPDLDKVISVGDTCRPQRNVGDLKAMIQEEKESQATATTVSSRQFLLQDDAMTLGDLEIKNGTKIDLVVS